MNSEKSLLTYLRHSRCDADQMGNKDSEIVASNEAPFSELLLGKINEKFAECFFSNHFKKNISDRRSEENFFENEDPENYDKRRISVFIAPVVFAPKKEHGEYRSDKKRFLIPVLFKAFLDSTGQLTPHSEPKAWIPREHLLPAFDSENFCIGTLDDQDKFTTNQSICEHSGSWSQVFKYVDDLIKSVTKQSMNELTVVQYERKSNSYIFPSDSGKKFSISIVKLYEYLILKNRLPLLLASVLRTSTAENKSLISNQEEMLFSLKHVGQMRPHFSLSESQRVALLHVLKWLEPKQENESLVLAITGPPGTGKTTLIQTVIANMWVESACSESEPPIIVACSTNNQAITNIINSFASDSQLKSGSSKVDLDALSGRWLSEIGSV